MPINRRKHVLKRLLQRHGFWATHPVYKHSDWQAETGGHGTRVDYWRWVYDKLEEYEHESTSKSGP